MPYLLAAKAVVAIHFGFVVFVFLGGLLVAKHRWVIWLHAPAIAWGVLISVVGWQCPLTTLEQWLLEQAGVPVYAGEFLPHYVWSLFGLSGSEVPLVASFVGALVMANLLTYRRVL